MVRAAGHFSHFGGLRLKIINHKGHEGLKEEPLCPLWLLLLFVPQRFDGIEVGGSKCWEHSTHDADQREDRGRDQ
jgi:hypothetical protein